MRFARAVVVLGVVVALCGSASAAPGQLDPRFGSGGKVVTMFSGGDARAYALALQPNGRVLAVGERTRRGRTEVAIARYDTSGRLDRTFGRGGKVSTSLGTDVALVPSVALQRDRRILVAGGAAEGAGTLLEFVLIRYLADGSIDHRFGSNGIVRTSFGSQRFAGVLAAAVQPDGRIVAAGFAGRLDAFASDIAVARYKPDGTLDHTFGDGGRVLTTLGSDSGSADDVVIQPDGRIVVSASRYVSSGFVGAQHGFTLVRYRTDGTLDPSFGANGIVTTTVGDGGYASGVALQPDGRIVVGGSTLGPFSDLCCAPTDFALARYLPDGTLDSSFGSRGVVTTKVGRVAQVQAVAVRPEGGIVAAGAANVERGGFVVAAYRKDGTPNPRFGRGGVIRTPFGGRLTVANALAIQGNGKIVVGGGGLNGRRTHSGFALVRYLNR